MEDGHCSHRGKAVGAKSTGLCSILLQENFVGELEAELQALQSRAEQAEASALALEETLKVGGGGGVMHGKAQ